MPHLAPISWLIIWMFIWSSFFLFSIIVWWKLKVYYSIPSLSTSKAESLSSFWVW
nr:ATP synthase F0 subunit 8 [Lirapex sp. ZZ-2022]